MDVSDMLLPGEETELLIPINIRGKEAPPTRTPVAKPPTNQKRCKQKQSRRVNGAADNTERDRAASVFGCTRQWVQPFSNCVDPLNPRNRVSGFLCQMEGIHKGSLYITVVNQNSLPKPQLIYGTPRMIYPYKRSADAAAENTEDENTLLATEAPEYESFPACTSFYLGTKWNGMNVVFFTYRDAADQIYVSATTRGRAFLDDSVFGHVKTAVLRVIRRWLEGLESPGTEEEHHPSGVSPLIKFNALPVELAPLRDADQVQSISFELCGYEEAHLVHYLFALELKPLFLTSQLGVISPIIPKEPCPQPSASEILNSSRPETADSAIGTEAVESLCHTERLKSFSGSSNLQHVCQELQQWGEAQNRVWRDAKGFSQAFFFNHFITEGWVLYLLDEHGQALNRSSLYKIKPKDIQGSHFEKFDLGVQKMVLLALQKCYQAGKDATPDNLRTELEWSERAWRRFDRDVLSFINGRPNPDDLLKAQEEERQKNPNGPFQRVIIMMGVPGSGKSTFAKRFLKANPDFERVNQDELKTRKRCEAVAEAHLKEGKSVIVDRCNFDYQQRLTWIKLARKYDVKRIELIWLNVNPELCKQRVSVRADHHTIAPGTEGWLIIDRFKSMLMEPLAGEGLTVIHNLRSEEDIQHIFPELSDM